MVTTTPKASFRRRKGPINSSQPQYSASVNDGIGKRRRRVNSTSSPSLLVKILRKHPNAGIFLFVSGLVSWLGLVALFLSKLPIKSRGQFKESTALPLSGRENVHEKLRAMAEEKLQSVRKGRKILQSASNGFIGRKHKEKSQPHAKRKRRKLSQRVKLDQQDIFDSVAAIRLTQMDYGNRLGKNEMEDQVEHRLNAIKEERRNQQEVEMEQKSDFVLRSTQGALDYSEPYVQKGNHQAPPTGAVSAFLAEEYLDGKTSMEENDDSLDAYYALDDDFARGVRKKIPDYIDAWCASPSFYRLYRPTCNEVHSTASGYHWLTGDHHSRFLGSGSYRNVFLLEQTYASSSDEVVFKYMDIMPDEDGRPLKQRAAYNPKEVYSSFELYDDMRKDSMVMESLTDSPRIANIYSFCALSSITEYAPGCLDQYVMPTGGEQDDEKVEEPTPVNDYIEPVEKLGIALEMAKGLATMHGYTDGVIVNVDVQIGQFCRGKDGLIKILDFNRAEAIMWDRDRGVYCPFTNGVPPDGSLRSPEEIVDGLLSEKIDVYSFGNLMYSVLTGLLVNRNYSVSKAHWRVTHGETEEINVRFFESRSAAEFALVKAIQWCWTFKAEDRPSIFDIVELLEDEMKKISRDRSWRRRVDDQDEERSD